VGESRRRAPRLGGSATVSYAPGPHARRTCATASEAAGGVT